MNYLNTEILYKNIQIKIPLCREKDFDLKLFELQNLLRNFVMKYVNRELFKQIKLSLKNYIDKKFILTTKIKSTGKNEISIFSNYEIKTAEFFITMKLSAGKEEISKDSSEGFYFNSSHLIVNESPMIFARNFSSYYNFDQIGKINFEKLICEKIKEFEKIHLYLIYEKCLEIKSLFFPFKIELNESNAKINFFYNLDRKISSEEKFLLFSIMNDVKGNLQIIDENFLIKSKASHKEQIKNTLLNILKNQSSNINFFNEILFESYFISFFNFNGIDVKYENLNPTNNLIILKILIHENKAVNRKCFLFIEINILRNTKFCFEEISLNVMEKSYHEDIVVNKINLHEEFFYKILETEKRKIEKFDEKLFKRILCLINSIESRYEELLVNLTEILNYSTVYELKQEKEENLENNLNMAIEGKFQTPIIKLTVEENSELLSHYIDIENLEHLLFYFREILIHNKNLIIKINLNEENLLSKFPKNLNNFSIFDTDNIIYYNMKEKSINIYFLTKMNVKNTVDFNYIKRFFTKILNKLLQFIRKISNLLQQSEVKEMLSHSENILISPIGLQFKYNFFEHSHKTILIHFINYVNSDKKNLKCLILPLEYHHHSFFSFDLLIKLIHECDETSLISNLKYFIFLSAVYNKISTRFSTYIFPIAKNTYDLINRPNKIFVFLKDYKTFHIIVNNKLSIFIEITSINTILIYSSYLWNSENCMRFMESIVNTQEILMKSNNADSYGNNQLGSRKLIILSNDPVSLLLDINKILNYIDKFE